MRESELGLEVFLTGDVPGIGGKLRATPEDFIVDEISVLPPEHADGKYVVARVWHRNWEANRLVRRIGSNLHVSRAKIGFAGTKDGRSVATQLMSFDAPIEAVTSVTIPDVRITDAYRARRMIQIGDLIGNRFRIRVADLDASVDVQESCRLAKEKLDATDGYPNFFGTQRFGSVRPITHLIGRDMVRGDLQAAVMRYVANPLEEDSDANDARRVLQETGDFERALREFPQKLTFERMLIGHMKDHPGDHVGALRTLPRNLLMMFVHAYQSYMFNRIVSQRIREGLPLGEPVVGDLVLPLTKTGVPDHDTSIPVTADNLEKATRNCHEGKAFVSGLIYGSESTYSSGRMGEIERAIVLEEGLKGSDFEIVGLREASSKGTRREILATYKDLKVEVGQGDVTFSFALNKGCYATSLLREFMKAEITHY